MPTNLYGIGDNFDLENSHVLPALLRKFHEAKLNGDKEVVMWGTGTPRREFLYSDDLADACIHLLETQDANSLGNQHINVGVGQDISIRELADLIKEIVATRAKSFRPIEPDGTLESCSLLKDPPPAGGLNINTSYQAMYAISQ